MGGTGGIPGHWNNKVSQGRGGGQGRVTWRAGEEDRAGSRGGQGRKDSFTSPSLFTHPVPRLADHDEILDSSGRTLHHLAHCLSRSSYSLN